MTAFIDFLPPSLILSTVLAVLLATLWYVWRGGGLRAWMVDVLAALLGFGAGQLVGWLLDLPLPSVGQVRVIEGTLFALLALWLVSRSTIDQDPAARKQGRKSAGRSTDQ